ncbi:MAG: GFA family protein, partial [bacterium]
MNEASCLCGRVSWEIASPLEWMSHCHCARCRKTHGSAFATYVAGPADGFRLRGEEHVRSWESSPGFNRRFCGACGSVVPSDGTFEGRVIVPAGNFLGDPEARPAAHIFVASKAPWHEITDDLPRFAAYPEG